MNQQQFDKLMDYIDIVTKKSVPSHIQKLRNELQDLLVGVKINEPPKIKKYKTKYKLAYYRFQDYVGLGKYPVERYELGIIDKKTDEFLDFYYSSGISYDRFANFIPNEFSEVYESAYEFRKTHHNMTAQEVLEAHGYVEYKEP